MKKKQKQEHGNDIFRGIVRIYGNIAKKTGFFLAFVAASIILAGVIVLPVWYFADKHRTAYSLTVLALLLGGILFLIIRNILRGRPVHENVSGGGRFLRFLWQFFAVLLFFAWLYGIVVVLLRGMIGASVLLIITLFTAFGFFLYGKHKTDSNRQA
jgi:hypothetical protein